MKSNKSAILLCGSGGNLSQEIAIIDQLIQKRKFQPDQKNTLIIASGTSAINAVALNACFREVDPCSWDGYYKKIFLETLSDDNVFMKVHPIQWSTHAMRHKIGMLLRMAGFSKLSDLPFHTSILISSTNRAKTVWLKSTSAKHENGDLTDILMASSTIPVLFPPQVINSVLDLPLKIKEGTYSEGSKNGLFFNFRKQFKKIIESEGTIEELFIISPQRYIDPSVSIHHKLSGMTFEERTTFANYLNQISLKAFINFLKELNAANYKHQIAKNIYVTLPETGKQFKLIEFGKQSSQYDTIYNWLEENPDKLTVELNQICENSFFSPHPSLV